MAEKKITIRGKKYDAPSIDRLKRDQAKQIKPLLTALIEENEVDKMWDMLAMLMPSIPEDVLDDLSVGEVRNILSKAGVLGTPEGITAGE